VRLDSAVAIRRVEVVIFDINEIDGFSEKLAAKFLSHGKRSLDKIWIWDAIKEPYTSYQPKDGIEELKSFLSESDFYWFIASDEDGKYWVLEGTGRSIVSVLSETRYFEYYVANKDISWLICENHHGVMVIKGSIGSEHKNS